MDFLEDTGIKKNFNRLHLTAGKRGQFCPPQYENLNYSIDRITLIADLDESLWERCFNKWVELPFIERAGAGLQVLDYSHCKVDDFGKEHDEVPPEQVAYIEMPRFQIGKLRIDFNPNHGMDSEAGIWLNEEVLEKLPNKHFSRADIAIDIFNHDEIKDYQVWRFGTSVRYFLDRGRRMETTYWGKSSSQKQIRLYNKKKEQEVRHGKIVNVDSWWRLEMQLRGNKVEEYPKLVAEMLRDFYKPAYKNPSLTESESNKVFRVMNDPLYYGSLDRKSKQRLIKAIHKAKPQNGLSFIIAQGFRYSLSRLDNELFTYKGRFHLN